MPNVSYPNQRMVKVHRESVKTDFLGIKNENWQAASRDLGAHALMLYLYLASNADGYNLALSPAAVRQAIGMARSTYHDQFHKLVDKGYLVPSCGNTFEFYEVPKAATQSNKTMSEDGQHIAEYPNDDTPNTNDVQGISAEDIEINNTENSPNNTVINNRLVWEGEEIQEPKITEIVIKTPVATGSKRPKPIEKNEKEAFVF